MDPPPYDQALAAQEQVGQKQTFSQRFSFNDEKVQKDASPKQTIILDS